MSSRSQNASNETQGDICELGLQDIRSRSIRGVAFCLYLVVALGFIVVSDYINANTVEMWIALPFFVAFLSLAVANLLAHAFRLFLIIRTIHNREMSKVPVQT